MRKRAPTLKDVALRAGTSKMAVSAVLNDSNSTVGVAPAARQRILEALEELKYRPNAFARSLRAQEVGTVGWYCSDGFIDTRDPTVRKLFQGLTEGLAEQEVDLLIYNGLFGQRADAAIQHVQSNKADAVIALPMKGDTPFFNAVRDANLPTITLIEPIPNIPAVCGDDAEGSAALARYLVQRGHRTILYRRAWLNQNHEQSRYDAFCRAAREMGADVIASQALDRRDGVTEFERETLLAGGGKRRVTAMACWRDYSAVRALEFCNMNGLQVPGDFAIAGFDGVAHAGVPPGVQLTTVDAHWLEVARLSTKLVTALISGETVPPLSIVESDLIRGNTA